LRQRLLQRWADHGCEPAKAAEKTDSNDLPNATLVLENSLPCDVVLSDNQILRASQPAQPPISKV
jgi:pantothenate kinase